MPEIASQISLTFWHRSFTFKFQHTLYDTGTKKGSIIK